jgi:hypothetical protein
MIDTETCPYVACFISKITSFSGYDANQGHQENRLSQQLFNVFIVLILRPLHVSAFIGHPQAGHTIYKEVVTLTTDPLYIVQMLSYTFWQILPKHVAVEV